MAGNPFQRPEMKFLLGYATYKKFGGAEAVRRDLRKRGKSEDEIEAIVADVERKIAEEKGEG